MIGLECEEHFRRNLSCAFLNVTYRDSNANISLNSRMLRQSLKQKIFQYAFLTAMLQSDKSAAEYCLTSQAYVSIGTQFECNKCKRVCS